jgi:hypothetical protein
LYWLKKKFYYWKTLDLYKLKVKKIGIEKTLDSQIWILNRYMIFFSNKMFYTRPFLAFWVICLKTLEFTSWWLGFLYNKFTNKSV